MWFMKPLMALMAATVFSAMWAAAGEVNVWEKVGLTFQATGKYANPKRTWRSG